MKQIKTAQKLAIESILECSCEHHIEHSQVTFLHNQKADGNTLKQLCDSIEAKILEYAQQLKPEWTAVEDNAPFHNDEQASESALIGALIGKHWSVIGSAHYFKGTWYYDHNGEEVPYRITHYIFYSSLTLPSLPNPKQ